MKNFKLLLSGRLFLALVVATLFASGVAEAQSAVPFKATIAITELIQPSTDPLCFREGHISGTGLVTHLGKVTLDSIDCITPNETAFSFISDQLVITVVANGDQIFASYSGIFRIEGPVGVISGGYQIVGGTGRYSQARGEGAVQGVEDITGQGSVELTGTISY